MTSDCGEPCARRTIFLALRQAAIELWGQEGLRQISGGMSSQARARCIEPLVFGEEMLPERFVLEWYEAVWEGPAGRNHPLYDRFLDTMMDHGFGKVRKFLLGVATPAIVVRKCGELWRQDHTHGSLEVRIVTDHHFELTLSDHPYLETPLGRSSIAEIYRYALSLARARSVHAKHWLNSPRTLTVRIDWV